MNEERQIIEDPSNKKNPAAPENHKTSESWDLFNLRWKQNIVTDVNAPQLYSRRTIYEFSLFFTVLFGGILLSVNLKKVNNEKAILPVLLFSVVYTALEIYITYLFPSAKGSIFLLINGIGAIVLPNNFWEKHIGIDFLYRTKPFLIPLIIGIIIAALFLWAMFAMNQI
ncbi:hypothetical protein SDC9_40638 [bioreactor metagenome]|uniref:Uncharacterized protein n=1 Tax=bioreactor metagenome TaxID=1076179 RepID=A0A644VSU9_9ZZZZ